MSNMSTLLQQLKQENIRIYSVCELNKETRHVIEKQFATVWITGELSNIARPSSGHIYFSLKDQQAQIRCALFRGAHAHCNLKDGQEVLVQAKASLYEARGEFQLIIKSVHPIGEGALQIAFEQLKKKLAAEGLFDEKYKKPPPSLPQCIGAITSSTGAAIQDILKTLKKRFPAIPVLIYPTPVQGKTAAQHIAAAIQFANRHKACDVLLIARGGGSLEDLWCFNEESVARSIFASQIPIISGVGHEIDYTIADFVADVRAPTPTAAAVQAVPDRQEWFRQLTHHECHLQRLMKQYITHTRHTLDHLRNRLQHPKDRLQQHTQIVDHLEQQLLFHMRQQIQRKLNQLHPFTIRMTAQNPLALVKKYQEQLHYQLQQFFQRIQHTLTCWQHKLDHFSQTLEALSPLKTLQRGYAIVTDTHKQIINDAQSVNIDDVLHIQLKKGHITAKVLDHCKSKP